MLIAALAAGALLLPTFDYLRWRRERRRVEGGFSRAQTSYGTVPYLDVGPRDGAPVLVATGGGSGIDFIYSLDWLLEAGYRVIAVTRPGYYDLPLKATHSLADHADIYAEVLRQLGVGPAHVFGISAGGPSALYYAARHPVRSLTLWSAITGRYVPNNEATESVLGRLVLSRHGQSIISWLLGRSGQWMPRTTMTTFLRTESTLGPPAIREIVSYELSRPLRRQQFRVFVDSTTPMKKLYPGMMHEMQQMGEAWTLDWTRIVVPVLAVASTVDKDVPIGHLERVEAQLPRARTMRVRAGGHFVWWGEEGQGVIAATLAHLSAQESSRAQPAHT